MVGGMSRYYTPFRFRGVEYKAILLVVLRLRDGVPFLFLRVCFWICFHIRYSLCCLNLRGRYVTRSLFPSSFILPSLPFSLPSP